MVIHVIKPRILEPINTLNDEKGYIQQDLADLTNISREYICDIENESRNKHISIAYLGSIALALDTDITNFFKK